MFIAMGIGMAVYGIAVGLLGYQGLGKSQPETAALLILSGGQPTYGQE